MTWRLGPWKVLAHMPTLRPRAQCEASSACLRQHRAAHHLREDRRATVKGQGLCTDGIWIDERTALASANASALYQPTVDEANERAGPPACSDSDAE